MEENIIPQHLENHCKKSRSTLMIRASLVSNVENYSYDTDQETSMINDYEKYEKILYNGMSAQEVSKEFCSVFDDLIKYTNYYVLTGLKDIYIESGISEDVYYKEIANLFDEIMPILDDLLDQLEINLKTNLSLKDYSNELIFNKLCLGSNEIQQMISNQSQNIKFSQGQNIVNQKIKHLKSTNCLNEEDIEEELKKELEKNKILKAKKQLKEFELKFKNTINAYNASDDLIKDNEEKRKELENIRDNIKLYSDMVNNDDIIKLMN
jgi:hypothetical protein